MVIKIHFLPHLLDGSLRHQDPEDLLKAPLRPMDLMIEIRDRVGMAMTIVAELVIRTEEMAEAIVEDVAVDIIEGKKAMNFELPNLQS